MERVAKQNEIVIDTRSCLSNLKRMQEKSQAETPEHITRSSMLRLIKQFKITKM